MPKVLRPLPAGGLAAEDHLVERNAARRGKSWHDLSERQKVAVLAAGAAGLGMAAAAWADLARRPADQVRGPKWRWALLIAVNSLARSPTSAWAGSTRHRPRGGKPGW
jgi:hypothetical protein